MTWLGRLLFGPTSSVSTAAEPSRILTTDRSVRCPECHSDQPAFEMLLLRDVALRDGVGVVDVISGKRLACQQCPCIYSVGPHGVFRHHHASQPYPRAPDRAVEKSASQSDAPPIPERAPILRMPLERPRV